MKRIPFIILGLLLLSNISLSQFKIEYEFALGSIPILKHNNNFPAYYTDNMLTFTKEYNHIFFGVGFGLNTCFTYQRRNTDNDYTIIKGYGINFVIPLELGVKNKNSKFSLISTFTYPTYYTSTIIQREQITNKLIDIIVSSNSMFLDIGFLLTGFKYERRISDKFSVYTTLNFAFLSESYKLYPFAILSNINLGLKIRLNE